MPHTLKFIFGVSVITDVIVQGVAYGSILKHYCDFVKLLNRNLGIAIKKIPIIFFFIK